MSIKAKIAERYKIVQAEAGALSYDTWQTKFAGDRNQLGFAAIYLTRENPNLLDPYILDAKRDGWFRKIEGKAKGYGLMVRSVKLSGRKTKEWASGSLTAVIVTFLPLTQDTDDGVYEESKGYLYVHNSIDAHKVIDYINTHKSEWVP